MRLALYQPDIPQNVGAVLRLGACLDVPVDVIGPCGFPFSDKGLHRAGMDYVADAELVHHASWERFVETVGETKHRVVLMTTKAAIPHVTFSFQKTDILLFGRESAGVPDFVHARAEARLVIPMASGRRSLNVATSAAMVLGEALRQTGGWPVAQYADHPDQVQLRGETAS